jgi:hypothetical protein
MAHPPAECRCSGHPYRHCGPGWRILTRSVGVQATPTATPALDGASSPAVSVFRPPPPPLRPWMAHPPAECRSRGRPPRHSGPGWRILLRSVGAAAAHPATPALDGPSSRGVSVFRPPPPPLRPWMAHPPLLCRCSGHRHRHCGPGWRILPCSVGVQATPTATAALDGASSPAVSVFRPPPPPLRPWMAHPHAQCRSRGRLPRHSGPGWRILTRSVGAPTHPHRHSGPGWRILLRSVGVQATATATAALDGASSRAVSEPPPTPTATAALDGASSRAVSEPPPTPTATPALDGASSRAVSEPRPPTPPLRPWMAHPHAQCRCSGRPPRHSGPGWRILTRSVGVQASPTATPALDGASSRAVSEPECRTSAAAIPLRRRQEVVP